MPPHEVRTRQRKRLDPDPVVRGRIVDAATETLRQEGVRGLSVSQVISRAGLGTRAFYRHFESKDQLVSAVFLAMARDETRRLRRTMASAHDPVGKVVAWIDARLDLAFDDEIESDLRQMSTEAQSQMFAAPDVVGPAYAELLEPLVDELKRGNDVGAFTGIDADSAAMSIQGVLWAMVERQWATGGCDRADVRRTVVTFCLRGLGVSQSALAATLAHER